MVGRVFGTLRNNVECPTSRLVYRLLPCLFCTQFLTLWAVHSAVNAFYCIGLAGASSNHGNPAEGRAKTTNSRASLP